MTNPQTPSGASGSSSSKEGNQEDEPSDWASWPAGGHSNKVNKGINERLVCERSVELVDGIRKGSRQ